MIDADGSRLLSSAWAVGSCTFLTFVLPVCRVIASWFGAVAGWAGHLAAVVALVSTVEAGVGAVTCARVFVRVRTFTVVGLRQMAPSA